MMLTDELAKLIHDGADEQQLRQQARQHGLTSLRQDGMRHLLSATTSVAELLRATGD
jgi:general secretion pathway protein E